MAPALSYGVRFAPSPTGRFHIGNLRTAWVSAKIAQAIGEDWFVRVEDIDKARSTEAAWLQQKADLAALGLVPKKVFVQSRSISRHLNAFELARAEGHVYACDCSRKDVLESLTQIERAPHEPVPEYSGTCRNRPPDDKFNPKETLAWRWRNVENDGRDDAIVARTDARGENFVPAYHWACAIDDAEGDYSVLVRAWDLATVEKVQREIRRWCIGADVTDQTKVFHTSLVIREDGGRLEKRTKGVTLGEFLATGRSVGKIIDSFEASFDLESALKSLQDPGPAGVAMGEALREISLLSF